MDYKNCILLVAGEPNSIFLEIFFKSQKKLKTKSPLILIASLKLVKLQMENLNFKKKIKIIDIKKNLNHKLDNKSINLINVQFNQSSAFKKISKKSNNYVKNCFDIAFKILKKNNIKKFINGPINKKIFLNKKYPGITEYITDNFKIKKSAMLIYNKNLSVCPITTHLPLKSVTKKINAKSIENKIQLIKKFYKNYFDINPRIGVLGLNPHCESIDKFNEDDKIIKPIIKKMKLNGYQVSGPHSADTIFLKANRNNYDVILGMYHDQVLTPIKTLFEYDAINITLGLPFLRISPDHGPNEKMMGKNLSNPLSLIQAIRFLDRD